MFFLSGERRTPTARRWARPERPKVCLFLRFKGSVENYKKWQKEKENKHGQTRKPLFSETVSYLLLYSAFVSCVLFPAVRFSVSLQGRKQENRDCNAQKDWTGGEKTQKKGKMRKRRPSRQLQLGARSNCCSWWCYTQCQQTFQLRETPPKRTVKSPKRNVKSQQTRFRATETERRQTAKTQRANDRSKINRQSDIEAKKRNRKHKNGARTRMTREKEETKARSRPPLGFFLRVTLQLGWRREKDFRFRRFHLFTVCFNSAPATGEKLRRPNLTNEQKQEGSAVWVFFRSSSLDCFSFLVVSLSFLIALLSFSRSFFFTLFFRHFSFPFSLAVICFQLQLFVSFSLLFLVSSFLCRSLLYLDCV